MHCRSFLACVFVCLCPLCVCACAHASWGTGKSYLLNLLLGLAPERNDSMNTRLWGHNSSVHWKSDATANFEPLSLWAFGCSCLEASAHTGCLSAREWNPTAKKAILSLFDVAIVEAYPEGLPAISFGTEQSMVVLSSEKYCYGRFNLGQLPILGDSRDGHQSIEISKMGWMP